MNFDPMEILKNFQQVQGQMEEMQEKLKDISAQGAAGGDLVKVTLNGKMEMIDIQIDPMAVDPRDVAMLQQLILSAYAGAFEKIQVSIKEQLGAGFPGMPGFGS